MTKPKKYFAYNLFMLQVFAQIGPGRNWPLLIKLLFYIYRGFIYFCFVHTLIFSYVGIRVYGFVQLSDIAMNILTLLLYSSITLRSIYFIFQNERVEYLMKRMNEVMKESGSLSPNPVTMERGRKISNWCLFGWWGFVGGAGLFLAFAPLFNEEKELPLPMWLCYDWTLDVFYYPTIIWQAFTQVFMTSSFANIEMFNVCANVLMTYQFSLLCDDFKHIIPNALQKCGMPQEEIDDFMQNRNKQQVINKLQTMNESQRFKERAQENFKVCIKHHQDLLNFRDDFFEFISPMMAVEVNFLFAYMIFVLFNLITTDNVALYPALSQYFLGIVAQIYINALAVEQLTNKVDELADVFYDIPWYFCDKYFRSSFKIVQLRMSRNDYLRAGGVLPISLETWLEFMKKAASFFAVLRQMNDEAEV